MTRVRSEEEQVARKQALSSLLRALDLIDHMAAAGTPLSLQRLSDLVGRPAPTVHRLLRTLELRNYVENIDGGYRLTLKMFDIGTAVVSSIDIVSEARPICQRLCEALHETVNMAVRSGTSAIYITKIESPRSLRLVTNLGTRVPLYCTALGRALVAFEPEHVRSELMNQIDYEARAKNTVTSRSALEREVEVVRSQGYAVDNQAFQLGLVCIAAPVFNRFATLTAAISVSAPLERLPRVVWEATGTQVRRTADEISLHLGFRSAAYEPSPEPGAADARTAR